MMSMLRLYQHPDLERETITKLEQLATEVERVRRDMLAHPGSSVWLQDYPLREILDTSEEMLRLLRAHLSGEGPSTAHETSATVASVRGLENRMEALQLDVTALQSDLRSAREGDDLFMSEAQQEKIEQLVLVWCHDYAKRSRRQFVRLANKVDEMQRVQEELIASQQAHQSSS
ncbi:unnamed protein product [Parajaminaea phylloscopi]